MLSRLFLLFTIVPAVELYLLLRLGERMGAGPTLALILLTGVLGAAMARREGIAVLQQLTEGLERGVPPAATLVEGVLVLVGGLLLVTPGVLTDMTGLLLLFPPTRRLIAPALLRRLSALASTRGVNVQLGGLPPGAGPRPAPPAPEPRSPFDHPVA